MGGAAPGAAQALDALQVFQWAATLAMNFAYALAVGASAMGSGLASNHSPLSTAQAACVQAALGLALAATAVGSTVLMSLQAAAMADVPWLEAAPAVHTLLRSTHYGHAWHAGMAALGVAGLCWWGARTSARADARTDESADAPAAGPLRRGSHLALAAALVAFAFSRSAVSHAIADGDVSWAVLVDGIHLLAIGLWVGEVALAGWVVLPKAPAPWDEAESQAGRAVMECIVQLSRSATAALGVIVLTGVFNSWRQLGGLQNLSGNDYGVALVAKLFFVSVAVALGAYNRMVVMPALMERPAPGALIADPLRRFVGVLRVESLVLLMALGAAAVLSSTAPPMP